MPNNLIKTTLHKIFICLMVMGITSGCLKKTQDGAPEEVIIKTPVLDPVPSLKGDPAHIPTPSPPPKPPLKSAPPPPKIHPWIKTPGSLLNSTLSEVRTVLGNPKFERIDLHVKFLHYRESYLRLYVITNKDDQVIFSQCINTISGSKHPLQDCLTIMIKQK